jgi:hypothetical protein
MGTEASPRRAATGAKRQGFFESESIDQLLSMMLELATELWVVRERLYVLERAAEQLGVPLAATMEKYRFTEEEDRELTAMRRRMLTELMRNVGRPHRPTSRSFGKKSARRQR